MTALRMDGRQVAAQIKQELTERVARLSRQRHGQVPGLATVLVGDDPASQIYVAGKHRDCAQVGIRSIRVDLPADASAQQVAEAIERLNDDPDCTGYIVQLPLPDHLDDSWALGLIDPAKDADGLSPTNLGRLMLGQPAPQPCTPRGIVELLRRYDVELNGADICIIGRGTTTGRPLSVLASHKAVNATVTQCHTGTRELAEHTRRADIVIAAAGRAHMVTGDMIKPGAVCVDVGVTRVDGKPVGDLAPDVWQLASMVTPNPGGVGPMTRAMLLANVVDLAEGLD